MFVRTVLKPLNDIIFYPIQLLISLAIHTQYNSLMHEIANEHLTWKRYQSFFPHGGINVYIRLGNHIH